MVYHVCLHCLGAPKSPQKVSGATQNFAKMDGDQVSSVGELRVTFFSFEQVTPDAIINAVVFCAVI